MDVADAPVVLVDDAQHVAAGESHVAGVEQERQRLARVRHQEVEFRLGLDRRGHVVVVGDRHALTGAPFGEGRHLAPVRLDLVLRELRLRRERRRAHALDRARGLAIDDAGGLRGDEEIHLRADAILLAARCRRRAAGRRTSRRRRKSDSGRGSGPSSSMFIGKRRPVSMPVKPATLACRRHSSRLTSSESSARSSFHHAIGAIPSLAFMASHSHALLRADLFLFLARFLHGFARGDLAARRRPSPRRREPRPRRPRRSTERWCGRWPSPIRGRLRSPRGSRNAARRRPWPPHAWRNRRAAAPRGSRTRQSTSRLLKPGTPLACCSRLMTA